MPCRYGELWSACQLSVSVHPGTMTTIMSTNSVNSNRSGSHNREQTATQDKMHLPTPILLHYTRRTLMARKVCVYMSLFFCPRKGIQWLSAGPDRHFRPTLRVLVPPFFNITFPPCVPSDTSTLRLSTRGTSLYGRRDEAESGRKRPRKALGPDGCRENVRPPFLREVSSSITSS